MIVPQFLPWPHRIGGAQIHWRMDPRRCAFIECEWSRSDSLDTLRILCGGCLDAPDLVASGCTTANAAQEPTIGLASRGW